MTTPQAGQAAAGPQAYRERLLGLLGARKPLEVLAQTAAVADVVRTHAALVLRTWPFEGKMGSTDFRVGRDPSLHSGSRLPS